MATVRRSPRAKLRGQKAIPHSLDEVIRDTFRLWRKHHLGYDQTKYVVERVRRRLTLQPPHTRTRTVARLHLTSHRQRGRDGEERQQHGRRTEPPPSVCARVGA